MRTIVVFLALSSSGCSCQQTGACDTKQSSASNQSSYAAGCGAPFGEPPGADLSVRLPPPLLDMTLPDDGGLDDGGLDDGGGVD